MTTPLRLPDIPFRKTTLDNGLDVVVRRDPGLPLVAVNLWYHVGSKNEERRQRGYAHLFEHLMFEGSEHFPGDFFKPLQRLGAAVNGSTSADRTNYFVDIPAPHFELALAMESDRMAHLIPALDEHKIRVQKDVVKNEYRQNYTNRPYGMAWAVIAEALYPPDHPYNWLTIGAMEDVEAASRDDVETFFRRYYVPGNASLSLVGDVDEDRAFQLADRYFGTIPGGLKAGRPRAQTPCLDASTEIRLHDRVELERFYLSWHSVPMFHEDDAALTLLADVLTRGRSGRLYRKLVKERELAQDVTAYQSGRELAGSFGVYATLRPGKPAAQACAIIDDELDAVAHDGVSPAELERVKNGRLAGFVYALESIGGFGGVADRLNAYNTYLGDPGRITTDFLRYQDVTPEAVRDVARRHVAGRFRVRLTVVGRGTSPRAAVKPVDRSIPPASLPAQPFRAPEPRVLNLRCGIPLWVLPRHELPVVALTIVLGGGAGVQPGDRPGLAQLTSSMMDEGTVRRSSSEIAEETEGMGTSLSTNCGWDGAYVSLQCLTPHLPASLDLAVDLLRNPSFPGSEWGRLHGQTVAALRAERDSAESRAHRGLITALYPPGHPYRFPIDGEEQSVASLTLDELVQFHGRFHGPGQAACVAAGDIEPERLAEAIDDLLSGWTGPSLTRPTLASPCDADRPRILLLDRPGAAQAAVRVGHDGLRRLDPDFSDALVLNHVLGGQFNSRLNSRLREQKGFTYGVRSSFEFRRNGGPFVIAASLQADKLSEALDDLRREVEALRDDRPSTLAELDDARRSLIEGQARHFDTPSALVSRYASLVIHDLPTDHHARFAERLDAVSNETLRDVAARQIRPEAFVYVVVADASVVTDQLRRLGWATVDVVPERETSEN